MPWGTCWPSQLQGIIVRHAVNAHCCSGVRGLGPAHGLSGLPQIGGSAWAAGAAPMNIVAAAAIVSPVV
ncbi:hypothetical protein [Mycobacterium sp.]|uniref:hypothetical protein n=1 Tax=Mycobacterium sp. TaxID=1785 RepID=UPI003BAFF8A5